MSDAVSNSADDNLLGEKHATTSEVKHSETVTDGDTPKKSQVTQNGTQVQASGRTEAELIEEMKNFDNLLKMLSVYRENPDLRGNPNDRHLEEIAKVLSKFIDDDDPENFLRSSDEDEEEESELSLNRPSNTE